MENENQSHWNFNLSYNQFSKKGEQNKCDNYRRLVLYHADLEY